MSTARDTLMQTLKAKFPRLWMRTTEEFDGGKGGIWTGAEGQGDDKGPYFCDNAWEFDPNETSYVLGVRRDVLEVLDTAGFYAEWYDSGTVMLYPK